MQPTDGRNCLPSISPENSFVSVRDGGGGKRKPTSSTGRNQGQFRPHLHTRFFSISIEHHPEGGIFPPGFAAKAGDKRDRKGRAWNEISSREASLQRESEKTRLFFQDRCAQSIVNVVTEKISHFLGQRDGTKFRGFIVHPKIKVFVFPLIQTIDIFIQDWEERWENERGVRTIVKGGLIARGGMLKDS